MKIKLFGKDLFEAKSSRGNVLHSEVEKKLKESKYLPDFYTDTYGDLPYIELTAINGMTVRKKVTKKPKPKTKKKILTPRGVYDLKMLNDKSITINADAKYVDEQLRDFTDKLSMISSEEFDMRNGVEEISSIVLRLENRKKYSDVKTFFEEYPYTTSSLIGKLTEKQDHLKLGKIAQFIADMPREATNVMKEYNKYTKKVCDKQAVFYIIADKKDFKQTNSRRDPILLAQSPFGHFWQILGAWDKEMLFLEEL